MQSPALAQACPGNPNALGTSRTITVNPAELPLIGTMQYRTSLPLKDHEVVLTFDDGPIPPYTTTILDILASQCVKATYFLVGEMARARPYLVRRIYNEGHSIGTHSQNHPSGFQHLSMQRAERQIEGGIDSAKTALGDPNALSPFFRIPGLGRTNAVEHYLESKELAIWSADIDPTDWRRGSSPGAIVQRAMRQLNAKGRGIVLMHDIHPATVMALPMLLKELKAAGYRIVHVEAAGERPKSLPELPAPAVADSGNWPKVIKVSASSEDEPVRTHARTRVAHKSAARTRGRAQRARSGDHRQHFQEEEQSPNRPVGLQLDDAPALACDPVATFAERAPLSLRTLFVTWTALVGTRGFSRLFVFFNAAMAELVDALA